MELRRKSQDLLYKALTTGEEDKGELANLAESIEGAIYSQQRNQLDYKESIRSHILNLKDAMNPLRDRVLSGEIAPKAFAKMDATDMATEGRRQMDEEMKAMSLKAYTDCNDDHRPRHRDLEEGST